MAHVWADLETRAGQRLSRTSEQPGGAWARRTWFEGGNVHAAVLDYHFAVRKLSVVGAIRCVDAKRLRGLVAVLAEALENPQSYGGQIGLAMCTS
jgi:hypothetical protein